MNFSIRKRDDGEALFQIKTIYGVEREHRDPYMTRVILGRLRLHIFHRGDNDPDPHDHPWDFWTFPLTSYVEEVTELRQYEKVIPAVANSPLAHLNTIDRYVTFKQVVPAWRWSYRDAEHTHRVLGRWNGRHKRVDPHLTIDPDYPMYDSYNARGNPEPMREFGFEPDISHPREVRVIEEWGGQCGGTRRRQIVPVKWHYESRPRKIVTIVWRSPGNRPWGFLKFRDGRWCWEHWWDYIFNGGKHAPCE